MQTDLMTAFKSTPEGTELSRMVDVLVIEKVCDSEADTPRSSKREANSQPAMPAQGIRASSKSQ